MISLRELARICGVSATTVSRGLRDDPRISQATRKRIREIAERLNYRPNRLAEVIFSGRVRTFAFIAPDLSKTYAAQILAAAQAHAFANHYAMMAYGSGSDPEKEIECIHHALENRTSGLLVSTTNYAANQRHFKEAQENKVPLVLVNTRILNANIALVHGDDLSAARQSVKHLIQLGHKKIGHLAEPRQEFETTERFQGYSEALIDAGIVPSKKLVRICQWSQDSGREQALDLLSKQSSITALFCANDNIAFGALQAAAQLGLRVPDDLSVCGVGNLPLSQHSHPPLTTYETHHDQVGRSALEALIDLQSWDPDTPLPKKWEDYRIAGELIPRSSSGPVRKVGKKT